MTEAQAKDAARERKCQSQLSNHGYFCLRPVEPGQELCVCHRMERTAEEEEAFLAEVEKVMEEGKAKGEYDFTGFCFPKAFEHFSNVHFAGNVIFQGAQFAGNADFRWAEIYGNASFESAKIGGNADFGDTTFGGDADFRGATLPPGGTFGNITVPKGKGESVFRFAKQVSQNMGEYRDAGEWHTKERWHSWYAKREKRTQRIKTSLEKHMKWTWLPCGRLARALGWLSGFPEQVFGQWVFGYGEKPLYVLRAMFAVIGISWVFYWLFPGALRHADNAAHVMRWWEAGYFSFVTFTTLGFGDWHPKPGSLIALVTMAEAFMGVVLAALFVVTLARRWGRG